MNIKNTKGITLLSLIITVIALIILVSVSVSIGTNIIEAAKIETVETNLLLIQNKAKILAEKEAMGEMIKADWYGELQTEGNFKGWYKLSQGDLNEIGLNPKKKTPKNGEEYEFRVKEEDGYYIDYENDDVAYEKGIVIDGEVFYKLSDILKHANR